MLKRSMISALVVTTLYGCSLTPPMTITEGERRSSYSYIPFDPLPVAVRAGDSCGANSVTSAKTIDVLPDQTVRIATAQVNSNGSITYGPGSLGLVGNSYQVVLDYMNTDTTRGVFKVRRKVAVIIPSRTGQVPTGYKVGDTLSMSDIVPDAIISRYEVAVDPEVIVLERDEKSKASPSGEKVSVLAGADKDGFETVSIPVYVGVGLRLTANITVLNNDIKITGLPAIAAEASLGNASGALLVQTLGITGKNVTTTLPLPNELNQATIQNAVMALGSIKAQLYQEETRLTPRVIGIYNPVGGNSSLVNGMISVLSRDRVIWRKPCIYK